MPRKGISIVTDKLRIFAAQNGLAIDAPPAQIKELLDECLKVITFEQLAFRMGVSKATLEKWIHRLSDPERAYHYSGKGD